MREEKSDAIIESALAYTVHGWTLFATFLYLVFASTWNLLVEHGVVKSPITADARFIETVVYIEVFALLTHIWLKLKSIPSSTVASLVILRPKTVDQEIRELINTGSVREVLLICYGTNRFGNVLSEVLANNAITLKLVLCDPQKAQHESDRAFLESTHTDVNHHGPRAVAVYSNHLPTIRAALLKDSHGKPLYCSVQSYFIHDGPRGMHSDYPAIRVAASHCEEMVQLVSLVEKEHGRLTNKSSKGIAYPNEVLVGPPKTNGVELGAKEKRAATRKSTKKVD